MGWRLAILFLLVCLGALWLGVTTFHKMEEERYGFLQDEPYTFSPTIRLPTEFNPGE